MSFFQVWCSAAITQGAIALNHHIFRPCRLDVLRKGLFDDGFDPGQLLFPDPSELLSLVARQGSGILDVRCGQSD